MFEERTYTVSEFNRMVKGYIEENPNLREFFFRRRTFRGNLL